MPWSVGQFHRRKHTARGVQPNVSALLADVRVVIHQAGEAAMRAGRILLGERRITAIGLVDRRPTNEGDTRLEPAGALATYDVLVSDELEDPDRIIAMAHNAGISCVLWHDGEGADQWHDRFVTGGRTLLTGANLSIGIASSLAAYETDPSDEVLGVECAWTEPGRPLRRGEAIPFPRPVGPMWATPRADDGAVRRYAAPIEGEWAAAMARITAGSANGVQIKVVGVSDLGAHLEGLALAAGALTVAAYPYGWVTPSMRADAYLGAALDAGLDVATFVTSGDAGTRP